MGCVARCPPGMVATAIISAVVFGWWLAAPRRVPLVEERNRARALLLNLRRLPSILPERDSFKRTRGIVE